MNLFSPHKPSPPSSILEIRELDAVRIIRLQGPIDMNTISELGS